MNFKFTDNIRYNFFPKPHFKIMDTVIFNDQRKISEIKDVNEAVQKYGKIYTLHTIVGSAEFNELKIKLGAKKWFG